LLLIYLFIVVLVALTLYYGSLLKICNAVDMGNIFREEFGYNKWLNKDRFKIRTSLSKNSRVIHQRNNFKTMFLSEIFSKPDKALFLIRVFKSYAIVNPKDETKFLFKINKLNQSFYFEYLKVDKKNFRKLFNSVWVYIWNGIRY
jgi:hypothetical protein